MYLPKKNSTWYCENCDTNTPYDELCKQYMEDAGRLVCTGCMAELMEQCVIHADHLQTGVRLSAEFNDNILTAFCNGTDILSTAILSHGYDVKESGEGWVDIDPADALMMKLGSTNKSLQSIKNAVINRIWEVYT